AVPIPATRAQRPLRLGLTVRPWTSSSHIMRHCLRFTAALRSSRAHAGRFALVALSLLTPAGSVLAQPAEGAAGSGASFAGQPIVSMVALVALTLLPFAFMTMTSFTKMSIVFSLLRNALGAGQVPSGLII